MSPRVAFVSGAAEVDGDEGAEGGRNLAAGGKSGRRSPDIEPFPAFS